MKDLGRVIAHVPARGGSQRVPLKNLRYIAGAPLLSYAVKAAQSCECLHEVYVNTDSEKIAAYAVQIGASVYRRQPSLASCTATSDQFNIDFVRAKNPDTLVMINPVCPFIDADDIAAALEAFKCSQADTLITTTSTEMQCFLGDVPININADEQLAPTQENETVHVCNWAITIWDAHKFQERFNRNGYAVLGGHRELLAIDPIKGIKISNEEDFRFAESIILATKHSGEEAPPAEYWAE